MHNSYGFFKVTLEKLFEKLRKFNSKHILFDPNLVNNRQKIDIKSGENPIDKIAFSGAYNLVVFCQNIFKLYDENRTTEIVSIIKIFLNKEGEAYNLIQKNIDALILLGKNKYQPDLKFYQILVFLHAFLEELNTQEQPLEFIENFGPLGIVSSLSIIGESLKAQLKLIYDNYQAMQATVENFILKGNASNQHAKASNWMNQIEGEHAQLQDMADNMGLAENMSATDLSKWTNCSIDELLSTSLDSGYKELDTFIQKVDGLQEKLAGYSIYCFTQEEQDDSTSGIVKRIFDPSIDEVNIKLSDYKFLAEKKKEQLTQFHIAFIQMMLEKIVAMSAKEVVQLSVDINACSNVKANVVAKISGMEMLKHFKAKQKRVLAIIKNITDTMLGAVEEKNNVEQLIERNKQTMGKIEVFVDIFLSKLELLQAAAQLSIGQQNDKVERWLKDVEALIVKAAENVNDNVQEDITSNLEAKEQELNQKRNQLSNTCDMLNITIPAVLKKYKAVEEYNDSIAASISIIQELSAKSVAISNKKFFVNKVLQEFKQIYCRLPKALQEQEINEARPDEINKSLFIAEGNKLTQDLKYLQANKQIYSDAKAAVQKQQLMFEQDKEELSNEIAELEIQIDKLKNSFNLPFEKISRTLDQLLQEEKQVVEVSLQSASKQVAPSTIDPVNAKFKPASTKENAQMPPKVPHKSSTVEELKKKFQAS